MSWSINYLHYLLVSANMHMFDWQEFLLIYQDELN